MSKLAMPKVAILGLDCAEPSLVFDRLRGRLPNLERLMAQGLSGRLRSCDPPITVPAWSVMMSGKDPGTLGIYGFRNRVDHSYDKMAFATSVAVREPRLWDYLGDAGKQSILLGIPGTYPPRPVNGVLVGCFLTPGTDCNYTYPAALREEIAGVVPGYMVDVPDFRTEDKGRLRDDIYRMTEKRFTLARHLIRSRPWDFFMLVEMGTDRIHHAFWKYFDPSHPKYEAGNRWEDVIPKYYVHVDELIGNLLGELPKETTVLIVSDHGAKAMHGGIRINEWLVRQGYLVLRDYPTAQTRFAEVSIDWSRTRAWSEGGYYARIFLNVLGREPLGVVAWNEFEALRAKLAREVAAIPDAQGRPLDTRCFTPQELYRHIHGIAPDLLAYFGNLSWRSVGTVGPGAIHTDENDTGPDDANHAQDGLYILAGPGLPAGRQWHGGHLIDVAPTLLKLFGLEIPADIQGQAFPEDVLGMQAGKA